MRTAALALACLVVTVDAAAQNMSTYRLKGTVKTDAGVPVDGAQVRAEMITGFQGGPITGASVFTAKTNKKGEWSILGLTAGTWVFEARADGLLPQVFVFPVTLGERQPSGAFNPLLPWDVPFTLRAAAGALAPLAAVAKTATPDNAQATMNGLTDPAKSTEPAVLLAAADIALLVRQPVHARMLYEKAAQSQPVDPLAIVGIGCASMMQVKWDAALASFWTARDTAAKELRPALGAAIKDLQKLGVLK